MLVCLYSNPCRNCENFDPIFPVPVIRCSLFPLLYSYLCIFVNAEVIIRSTGCHLASEELSMMPVDIWHFGSHFTSAGDNI
ncbi:MAG: hypothetical protein F6J90_07065 [Moorea sp. SIOASIH]|nr:hypothetical protein [Moorena sp. SIOASIH]